MVARNASRAGMLLILVVAFAAILVAITVVYLGRMRSDASEATGILNEAQARVMLYAAMNYIQETARIGWHPVGQSGRMVETYGWTDIRDGSPGPRDQSGTPVWSGWGDPARPVFPMPGGAARFPMHVHQRPPYAVAMDRVPNRFSVPDWSDDAFRDAAYRMDALPVRPVARTFDDFVDGDLDIRTGSAGLAWFRIYREADADHDGDGVPAYDTIDHGPHHGIFVITCGAGGTLGFRDWDEVIATYPVPGDRPFDRSAFETMRAQESILWYRVAYSAAVSAGTFGNTMQVEHSFKDGNNEHHWPFRLLSSNRESDPAVDPANSLAGYRRSLQLAMPRQQAGLAWVEWLYYGGTVTTNALGTIEWIMRLESRPANW